MKRKKSESFRSAGSMSWSEREEMIKEYLAGDYSKVEIWRKYTGQTVERGKMLNWMRILGYADKVGSPIKRNIALPLAKQEPLILTPNQNDQAPKDLYKRIKELERQLENAQLKAEGYELMIEIAEKELKIPIRKKSDTK